MDRNKLINELSKYFKIQELVCPHCYNKFGEASWQFLSTELLSILYTLRVEIFNKPMTVNTWHNNGQFSQRGLRCNICQLVKSKSTVYISSHLLGKAIDFNVKDLTDEEVRNTIKSDIDKFKYPIRLERSTTGWSHIDCYQPKGSTSKLIEFNG